MKRPKAQVFDPVAPQPRRCYFCKSTENLVRCAHPVVGPTKVFADELTMADFLITQMGRELRPLVVNRFRRPDGCEFVMYALDYDEAKGWGRSWLFYKSVHERLTILRARQCMLAACELHSCERGPKRVYCANHWSLPETAAPARAVVDPLRSRESRKLEKAMEAQCR
jgi:hypothetical protein